MSYMLYDDTDSVGAGPSIGGLRNLKAFLVQQDLAKYPSMYQFIEHGMTHKTLGLAVESRKLASICEDTDTKATLTSLAASATKAKGIIALVSHHT